MSAANVTEAMVERAWQGECENDPRLRTVDAKSVAGEKSAIRRILTAALAASPTTQPDGEPDDTALLNWLLERLMFMEMSDGSVRLTLGDGYTVPGMRAPYPLPYNETHLRKALAAARSLAGERTNA
jgi:hypothetical protein